MPQKSAVFAIAAPRIFDGDQFLDDHCLVVRGETIEQVLPVADCPQDVDLQRLSQGTLAPGFIDLQVNGGGNVLLHNTPSVAAIETMLRAHRAAGTTSMLPTLLSGPLALQQAAVEAVAAARNNGQCGVLGLHLEGPFFNTEKRGAHEANSLRGLQQADVDWLCAPRDFILMATLAPEQVELQQIQELARAGVIVCAGHTNASYDEMTAAAAHGLRGVTHLFNAMRSMTARQPGALGAALDSSDLWAGIIADGHHVHPAGIRLAHAAKPAGKLVLVSDAMATVGGSVPCFELYGEEICLREGRLVNAQGALAGSAIGLIEAVGYCHQTVGLPLEECLRMASLYPARVLQLGHRLGHIADGVRADLVHFDAQFTVCNTWSAGQHMSHQAENGG